MTKHIIPKHPSVTYLHDCFNYDPVSGELRWKKRPRHHYSERWHQIRAHRKWAGRLAGGAALHVSTGKTYVQFRLGGRPMLAHRVIFAMWAGVWPDDIDHINGNGADNRWANLRGVTRAENGKNMRRSKNNTSGVTGVYWVKKHSAWQPSIHVDGRHECLGTYYDFFEACCARKSAEARHGFHVNHGTNRPL